MKTFIRYITLLLVSGVIIPFCISLNLFKIGSNAYKNTMRHSAPYHSITAMVLAKILPVLHFFQ